MKLLIISTAPFIFKNNETFAYSPYVNELIIYEKFCNEINFCCPVWKNDKGLLISKIPFNRVKHYELIDSDLLTLKSIFQAFFQSIYNVFVMIKAMREADHIHLRCPGSMALLGCFVQILFPNKIKTAKYAGNWDPKNKQPWSYRLQKWILSNAFLTRNMQVLVYGDWENQSKNIKSFFTATYSESEKENIEKTDFKDGIKFIFVGSLVQGKNPLYGVKLVEKLMMKGHNVTIDLYGDGVERESLENYVQKNKLEKYVILKGNHNKETLKKAYQQSHFVILPSKSEGWPKAIAEGMFWGCAPIATIVSCVPYMLDSGKRGTLLEMDLDKDARQIEDLIMNQSIFFKKSQIAMEWSRNFTTDVFEKEIAELLIK